MAELLLLSKDNCKNCYRCIRECAVKAIRFSDSHASIIGQECVFCGHCYTVCPQSAKQIRSDVGKVQELLASGRQVLVSLAPSYIAEFPVSGLQEMRRALCALGFADVEETARGAKLVKSEYERLLRSGEVPLLISSCCHSVNLLIQKHYPKALACLAQVQSPMLAHARLLKQEHPGAAVVFIGPCISKKAEAEEYGEVDCVLTYEELRSWMEAQQVELPAQAQLDGSAARSRFFPVAGGILRSMHQQEGITYLAVDGLQRCMQALEEVEQGGLQGCFLELSACEGSCVGGPAMRRRSASALHSRSRVECYSGAGADFPDMAAPEQLRRTLAFQGVRQVQPGEAAIRDVLQKLGKTRPEDELNCGGCGYSTCREKAAAVCQGKADLTMCLPFLMARAESFSSAILANTPNAIFVLDTKLCIQQMNEAAGRLFQIENPMQMKGMPIDLLLGPVEYMQAIEGSAPDGPIRHYLAEYDKYVEETIVFDSRHNIVISIIKDITEETRQAQEQEQERRRVAQLADTVIEKQMRVAQEIASLLGETTAETKIALTRLKNTME